jgi:hypothetical protein
MLKYLTLTILWSLGLMQTYAQENDGSYLIDDKFPEYTFAATHKDSSYKFTLDKYKGKSVIIDLWDVYCAGCISGIQKLDSLQKIFNETLQIILVTKNSKEQVDNLFSRKNLRRPDLPMIIGDTTVYDVFFPHDGNPLHVWIDTSRIIRYITGGYNTTHENIRKFMNKESLKVSFQTKLKNYDPARPLIEDATNRLKFYTTAYSIFTKGLHNIVNLYGIQILRDKNSGAPYSIKVINATPLTLYQIAFNRKLYGIDLNMFQLTKNNRIMLDSERAASLIMPKEIDRLDSWKDSSLFCYELSLPIEKSNQIFQWMQQDLLRFFDLDVSIQKRRLPCLILTNAGSLKNGISERQNSSIALHNQNEDLHYTKRKKMAKTIESLIYLTQTFNLPFVDQTNANTDLSIPLPLKVNSIDELNQLLKNYGLLLVRENREIDFLIIK